MRVLRLPSLVVASLSLVACGDAAPVVAAPDAVDVVLVVDTYHHIDARTAYFTRLRSSLRPQGRVAIVDFRMDSPEGPPVEMRLAPEVVRAEMEAAGYSLAGSVDTLARQYLLIFQAAP